MRQLILLRHGEAEPRAASGHDRDRALTPRGRRQAAEAGAALAGGGLAPDRVLVSDARRTQETWSAAATALAAPGPEVRADLYDAPAEALLAAARSGGEVVAVVAHNPGIGALAAELGDAGGAFPPGALAVFAWGADGPRIVLRCDPA